MNHDLSIKPLWQSSECSTSTTLDLSKNLQNNGIQNSGFLESSTTINSF